MDTTQFDTSNLERDHHLPFFIQHKGTKNTKENREERCVLYAFVLK
jgi:hypothetical protein